MFKRLKNNFRLIFIISMLIAYPFFLICQPIGLKSFPLQDGSVLPKINCVVQTSQGYLLLGTTNGLFSFNGLLYSKITLDSFLGSQIITSICEIRTGEIWIGFQNGVLGKIKSNKVLEQTFEEGKFGKPITKILTDSIGSVWCGTAGEGLYCYKNKRWINFNIDDGMSDNYVYDLAIEGSNSVVCGTDDGVNYCGWKAGKKEVRITYDTSRPLDKIIRRIMKDDNNSYQAYFAGTQDYVTGYFMLNDLQVRSAGLVAYSSSQTNALAKTPKNIWIGTEADGIWYYNYMIEAGCSPQFSRWKPRNKIQNLLVDNQKHLWLTSDNELIRTQGDQLLQHLPMTDTEVKQCHAILGSKNNSSEGKRIWFNYENGLKEIIINKSGSGNQILNHPIPQINKTSEITSLYEDDYNNIWIGTMGKGILILNKKTHTINAINDDELLINGSILSITGKENSIWISSLGGAVKCTISNNGLNRAFTNYNEISGIGTNYIYNIFIDSKNRVWFATDGKGITKFENGKFTNYNKSSGLKSEVVYSIAEDNQGCIWLNALNEGLYCFNEKTFTNFTVADGLSDNNIASILADGNGNIVAISSKAIDVINPVTKAIYTIDAEQGIKAINADLHSAAVNNKGAILFCSSSGIIELQSTINPRQLLAYIERTTLFLKDFDASQKSTFNTSENNISIHFNAIDLAHPDRIQFQYMLEGMGKEWVTTRDHYINFPKLPPGTYTFKVRASMSTTFNNSPQAVYSFKIARPLWQRLWFISLSCLIFSAAIWLFIRYRVSAAKKWQLLQKENLQSRLDTLQSQVSPHFFFNSLNTLISLIEEEPKMAVAYTNHLSDFFRKIVQYRDKDVIPLTEEIDLITDYFFIQEKRFGTAIKLIVNIPEDVLKTKKIAPLSLQLLAENAMKHNTFTPQWPLLLLLSVTDNIWLQVKNNYNAKQNPVIGAGMGLQNIQRRYKLLTGKDVEIQRDEHFFIVTIPLI